MGNSTKYEEFFSNWLFDNLPNSLEGTQISDIDFVIGNYKTKKFMLLELKTKGADIKFWQKQLYSMLHKRLLKTNGSDGWTFMGTNLLKFENKNFNDGNVWLNGILIDEFKMQEFLFNKLGF